MYTPFDFNEALGHRKDYIEDRLREGSPVVGLAYADGLLLFTVKRTQRKIYEIYDRQMFSAIGNQSDIENIRLSAIQMAHQEGFERSPDDVSVQRLVGFALSPALKKAFGDQLTVPFVVRALFAEIGSTPAASSFFSLNYDGEFRQLESQAVIAGTQAAEDRMIEILGDPQPGLSREEALKRALTAWTAGAREALRRQNQVNNEEEDIPLLSQEGENPDSNSAFLRDELKTGFIEAAVLEQRSRHEFRFRLLAQTELAPLVQSFE